MMTAWSIPRTPPAITGVPAATPAHLARGEWLISRVYAVLQRPEPALYHARRVLDLCQDNGIGDFDLAFAYEALARAHATAGGAAQARHDTDQALAAARPSPTTRTATWFWPTWKPFPASPGTGSPVVTRAPYDRVGEG
jgi:tetratricopeptide (TPR) repeat protein